MVQKNIRMARAQGIPTIDGVQYFNALERPPGNWHSIRTEANHDIYLRLFEDARNVAYAITPHGSYSKDREVPLRHIVAGAVPPQGGQPAGSSGDYAQSKPPPTKGIAAAAYEQSVAEAKAAGKKAPRRPPPTMKDSWPPPKVEAAASVKTPPGVLLNHLVALG